MSLPSKVDAKSSERVFLMHVSSQLPQLEIPENETLHGLALRVKEVYTHRADFSPLAFTVFFPRPEGDQAQGSPQISYSTDGDGNFRVRIFRGDQFPLEVQKILRKVFPGKDIASYQTSIPPKEFKELKISQFSPFMELCVTSSW